jgi:hypothetical protein
VEGERRLRYDTDLPSPPLSRLVALVKFLAPLMRLDVLGGRLIAVPCETARREWWGVFGAEGVTGEVVPDIGLEAWLLVLGPTFGGWGNEPILIVLRNALLEEIEGGAMELGAEGIFGRLDVATWCGSGDGRGGIPEGDRLGNGSPVDEGLGVDGAGDGEADNEECRVFGIGIDGSGAVGGRDGLGRAVVAIAAQKNYN